MLCLCKIHLQIMYFSAFEKRHGQDHSTHSPLGNWSGWTGCENWSSSAQQDHPTGTIQNELVIYEVPYNLLWGILHLSTNDFINNSILYHFYLFSDITLVMLNFTLFCCTCTFLSLCIVGLFQDVLPTDKENVNPNVQESKSKKSKKTSRDTLKCGSMRTQRGLKVSHSLLT